MQMREIETQPETFKVLVVYPGQRPTEMVTIHTASMGDELRAIVGGYIEIVRPKYFPDLDQLDWAPVMIVNEDGISQQLSYNERASIIYWPGGSAFICGPAIIMQEANFLVQGENYWEGDLTGLPDNWSPEPIYWGTIKSDAAGE